MKKVAKTILLENGGLLTSDCEKWIKSIDKNYLEVDSEVRSYMRSDDLFLFAMFINPKLQTIATSSAFPSQMPYEAYKCFNKEFGEGKFTQLDYFSWVLYNAVAYRKKTGLNPLTIEVNYKGYDFLEDLKNGEFGEDIITYLKLMLRQSESHITINLYTDYKLVTVLKTEEDLKLNNES